MIQGVRSRAARSGFRRPLPWPLDVSPRHPQSACSFVFALFRVEAMTRPEFPQMPVALELLLSGFFVRLASRVESTMEIRVPQTLWLASLPKEDEMYSQVVVGLRRQRAVSCGQQSLPSHPVSRR